MASSSGWVCARVAARSGRIQPPVKQLKQFQCDARIGSQHALHVALTEGQSGLQQVATAGAQHHDLARRKAGKRQQPVETIILGRAAPDAFDGGNEPAAKFADVEWRGVGQLEVLDSGLAAFRAADLIRMLGDHAQAEILHDRHDIGDRRPQRRGGTK